VTIVSIKDRERMRKRERDKKLPAGRRALDIPNMTLLMVSCPQSRKVPMLMRQ
jgi:hypothetical protein